MFDLALLKLDISGEPRADRVMVLPLLAGTRSTLLLTDASREQPQHGLVLQVGPGGIGPESGRAITVFSTVGELVTYGKYAGIAFDVPGAHAMIPVWIMRDSEVLYAKPADAFELIMHDDDPRKIHLAGLICEHCPSYVKPAPELPVLARVPEPEARSPFLMAEQARIAAARNAPVVHLEAP